MHIIDAPRDVSFAVCRTKTAYMYVHCKAWHCEQDMNLSVEGLGGASKFMQNGCKN